MGVMDEREWFRQEFPGTTPEALWGALMRALSTMDLRRADDEARVALFGTGISWTSWGQHLRAEVAANPAGSTLTVRGRPRGSLLSSAWGERVHVHRVRTQLVADMATALREPS